MDHKLEQVILFQIDKTSKISKIYSQREFDRRGLGINIDQWVLLKIIHENEGISQRELATISHRDPASITRTLSLLEKKGLVSRKVIPENKRQHEVFLSEEGRDFIEDNMPMVLEHRAKSLEGFSNVEVQLLHDLLLRIQENMK